MAIDVEGEETAPLDPLAAPRPPQSRDIPESIFDSEERRIDKRDVLVKILDADRDGRAEVQITYDHDTGELLSRQEDTDYDGLLERFPVAFHEPYYADYIRHDLTALFEAAGLKVEQVETVYLSRLMVLTKS